MASPAATPSDHTHQDTAGPAAAGDPVFPADRPDAEDVPADAAALWLVGLRDAAIATAALSLFGAADAWYAVTGIGFAALLSVVNGLLVGVVLAGLSHEWGHFAGARGSGGTAPLAPLAGFFPMFNFDFERSDVGHFQAMSIGGNLAPALVAVFLFLAMPLDTPGRVALVSAVFGFAAFTLTVEYPVIRRVRDGMGPSEALGRIVPEGWIRTGAVVGAATTAVLAVLL